MRAGAEGELLRQILGERSVSPLFQPLVDLDGMFVAGYEALARGPIGPLQTPDALFAAAREQDVLAELDWLCRERAVEIARANGLRHPLSLFVNAEPAALLATSGDADRWGQFNDLRCYAEITERALAAQPAALLRAVEQVREQDWGIAVDDVGSNRESLALLPLVQPDVIKLDMSLLRPPVSSGDQETAVVLHGALAQAQQTGAVVVAEGIETEAHLDLARALGAHYGQGYLLGRPAALPGLLVSPPLAVPLVPRVLDRSRPPGPFALVSSSLRTRQHSATELVEVSRQLLARAGNLGPHAAVLISCSDTALFVPTLAALLDTLAGGPLTALAGSAACRALVQSVAAHPLDPDDPAHRDFAVAVVSPHYAAALVARPALAEPGRYDAALTLDRQLATAAGTALARRMHPPAG